MCTCNRSTAGATRILTEMNVSREYSTSFATDSVVSCHETAISDGNVTRFMGDEHQLQARLQTVFEGRANRSI